MGYYTNYSLEVMRITSDGKSLTNQIPQSTLDFIKKCWFEIDDYIDDRGEFEPTSTFVECSELNFESDCETKWYEHEEDMKSLSEKVPNVLFVLTGIGEESPDLWKKYFYNGMVQEAPAVITYEAFDLNKLTK